MSRGDYAEAAKALGAAGYVRDGASLMRLKPDVVVLCTSIVSTKQVLLAFPPALLESTLVVDVLSVKAYPKQLLLELLPRSADILCTHPMFGPESGRHSWAGLPFVFETVRASDAHRVARFLRIWERERCVMEEMSCEQHDEYAASTQFVTHTTGRMLGQLSLRSTPVNTKGYEALLSVVDTTCKDSFELFYGLYKFNANAKRELDKMEVALRRLRAQLEQLELESAADDKTKL
uniref:Prephenate/arogenate dehydrogenase domain-containing protein n=1 Tax=Erythrolobus australicus TaxID=1077150 RepID=A0A7S1TLD2_9RHOD